LLDNIGAVCVITGKNKKTLTEAYRLSKLLRYFNPRLRQTVVIDKNFCKEQNLEKQFDNVVLVKENIPTLGFMGSKILALKYSPYKKTLILDCDTLPTQDITFGFSLINEDRRIALSIAPRQEINHNKISITNFQNGVMFVLRTPETLRLFDLWHQKVCENNPKGPTRFIFSQLLYEKSHIGIYPLSYKWNFRVDLLRDYDLKPKVLKRVLPEIKIFHSHLKREIALKIIKQYPKYSEIKRIAEF
jgi:hypothetical protein